MTPEEAEALLRHAADLPRRVRRYVLEGGRRCVWTCALCKCSTAAETYEEALGNLLTYTQEERTWDPISCLHPIIVQYQTLPMPPEDFS